MHLHPMSMSTSLRLNFFFSHTHRQSVNKDFGGVIYIYFVLFKAISFENVGYIFWLKYLISFLLWWCYIDFLYFL